MELSNLTTRLNIKAIGIISVFMLFFTIYNHWVSFQEKEVMYNRHMELFTHYLESVIPADLLVDYKDKPSAEIQSLEKQILAVNNKIQPILNSTFIPLDIIKFGVYSSQLQRLVAIGPELDKALLLNTESKLFDNMFRTDTLKLGQQKQSVLWYGATISYVVKPIKIDNQIVGYIFVCVNIDKVMEEEWQSSQRSLFGSLVALLIVIILFQEIFVRLRKELILFAEATVNGRGRNFESKITELNPILRYINEQTEQMARLDRLNIIGEMAASIGHEVRNPMTTVRGFLQYLGNKPALENYQPQFALMITELDRANSIITEFLSLAKNKAMNFQHCDLNDIIREMTPLLEADALRYNCQINMELHDIPAIRLDKSSIRQLILNIVRNGIEAMPQGGTLTISTYCHNSQVFLTFVDEGTGIPLELIDKLGTPFFTTKENGVGLGLAICYRVVQRHNGTMSVENQPERGTKFTITFTI
ncbi:ATP-binding protein [Sporomusa sphaeroides]|uniref:ATP-binding protein n=1 Tax=Sporomusa sphaeroides TaxID=47679 RepID=UPI003D9FE721